MVDAATAGGMGLTDKRAAAIYGLYTAGVYLLALPGGWIADRILGQRSAVFLGGVVIALRATSAWRSPPPGRSSSAWR